MSSDDRVDAALAQLPPVPMADAQKEQIRQRSQRALARSGVPGWRGRWLWLYDRFLEPVSLGGITLFYLHWAFRAVALVYGL